MQVYPALAKIKAWGFGAVAVWVAGTRWGQESGETCRDILSVHDLGAGAVSAAGAAFSYTALKPITV